MSRQLVIILSLLNLLSLTSTSCIGLIAEDPADKFVGDYSYNDTYSVNWGSASGSFTNSGSFTISKQSSNTVYISSPWNTTATATGIILNISPTHQSDYSGYVNYTFSSASLSGGMLSITYHGMGSVKYSNGISYPYSCQGNIMARKVN